MPELTPEQFARVVAVFRTMNPHAHMGAQKGTVQDAFYYDGYVNLEGLFHLADVLAEIRCELAAALLPTNRP